MNKMHSNLKLINPLKENDLFSIHKYKKMTHSNFSTDSYFNTKYKPFNTQKYSLLSSKKTKKFGVSLTETNSKSKTNYTINNQLSHIPYPSFPGNNRIPAIYKNSNKLLKYPKILNNNHTIYYYNKPKNINIKQYLLSSNLNSKKNIYNQSKKDNNKNKTYSGDTRFLKVNEFLNSHSKLIIGKKDSKKIVLSENVKNKKIEVKPNVKVKNFNSILDNIIHLIEIRDQNNNSVNYIKVTNLLLSEINKLFELQREKKKEILKLNKATSTYKKIKINKRKLRLSDNENDISFIKRKNKRQKSLKIKGVDVKFQKKYGFDPESVINIKNELKYKDGRSEISGGSKDSSLDDAYQNFYGKKGGVKYKDEYLQTTDRLFRTNNYNYSKGNNKHDDTKKIILNINEPDNINNNINENLNIFPLDNHKNNNSIFNNFINKKKNKKKEKEEKKENTDKIEIIEKKEKRKKAVNNQDQMDLSHLLNNIASKINISANLYKVDPENNSKNKKTKQKEIPIFEQLVNNEKLIKLIHEYMNKEKKEEAIEEEEYTEEENINEENEKKDEEKKEVEKKEEKEKDEEVKEEFNKIKLDKLDKDQNIDDITKNVKRRKRRARTYILPKIELGMEIIKHICNEINIDKNDKDNLEICLFNLMKISRKENRTQKENELQKKLLKPINEITQKFLENMLKINSSNEKPKSLFSQSLKLFLREKLNEILEIQEDNNEDEKKKENQKRKKMKEQKQKKKKNLIFDNSYFFKKDNKKKPKDSSKTLNKNDEDENLQKSFNQTSTSFNFDGLKKKNSKLYKDTKLIKSKKTLGLLKLSDEKENILETKDLHNEEEENRMRNEDILDRRLQAFFGQIRELKNIKNSRDEEKLRLFIDKEIEKFDYTQEKKIEARKYNFFNDLKVARITFKKGQKYYNNKLLFHSPLIFNIYKNKNNE